MLKILLTLILINMYLFSNSNIVIYSAYGNAKELIIQGRMQKPRDFKEVNASDNWLRNVWRRAKEVKADDIKNKEIFTNIDGITYKTKGDSEGYYSFDVLLAKPLKNGYKDIFLQIKGNKELAKVKALILTKPAVGIISDFDDTLIVSNVPNRLKLGINTVFKNYKQRKAIKGMATWFKEILAKNPKNTPSTLFILSGSPQQLFKPIEGFLNYRNFPKYTLILKKAHGDNKDPLTDQFAYKVQKIEKLIKLYPNIKWYMFGDSGEKDREVYSYIEAKYPNKVIKFFIRDIKSGEIKKY
jgi:phosphatidate phosphatase APP1